MGATVIKGNRYFMGRRVGRPCMRSQRVSGHRRAWIKMCRDMSREMLRPYTVMLAQCYREDGCLGWSGMLRWRRCQPKLPSTLETAKTVKQWSDFRRRSAGKLL